MTRQTVSTVGLPKGVRGKKANIMPPLSPGSLVGSRAADDARAAQRTAAAIATYIVTPLSPLRELLKTRNRVGGGVTRIMFSDGDYNVGAGNLDIDFDDVQLIAMTPGGARLVRNSPAGAPGRYMFSVNGARFVASGLAFADSTGGVAVFDLEGDNFDVNGCLFSECHAAVRVGSTSSGGMIRANRVLDARSADVFEFRAGASEVVVLGNQLRAGTSGNMGMVARSGSLRHSFVGNITEGGAGTITYTGADGSVNAANIATVTVL